MGQFTANGIESMYDTQETVGRARSCSSAERSTGGNVPAARGATALVEAGYRVVTFDNRGMVGAACPTPPRTVWAMADAGAVLAEVGPAHVLGVSLGALITQTLAIRHPELVVANELDPIFPARGLRDVAAAVPTARTSKSPASATSRRIRSV